MTRSVNTHRVLSGASTERLPQYLLTNLNRPDNIWRHLVPSGSFQASRGPMLIGNDHASIALVTLDDKRREDERRSKPLRALARSHGLAATPCGAPKGAPAITRNRTRPERRITLAVRPACAAVVPREDTGAQSQHGNDALRRERAARSAKATAPGDAMPRLALRPDGSTSVLGRRAQQHRLIQRR